MPKTARPVYVRPVKGVFKRVDQGVDYQGTPGDHVVAIGRARIDRVSEDAGGFGKAVYYTLLDGPMAGQQIYVGHAMPTVKAGQVVGMGQAVATLQKSGLGNAAGLPGWVEIGFASNNRPTATSEQDVPGSPGNKFLDFVNNLSATPATGSAASASSDVQGSAQAATIGGGVGPFFDTSPAHPADVQQNQGVSTAGPGMPQEQLAGLWQQIANQQFSSPESRMFAQNADMSVPR